MQTSYHGQLKRPVVNDLVCSSETNCHVTYKCIEKYSVSADVNTNYCGWNGSWPANYKCPKCVSSKFWRIFGNFFVLLLFIHKPDYYSKQKRFILTNIDISIWALSFLTVFGLEGREYYDDAELVPGPSKIVKIELTASRTPSKDLFFVVKYKKVLFFNNIFFYIFNNVMLILLSRFI